MLFVQISIQTFVESQHVEGSPFSLVVFSRRSVEPLKFNVSSFAQVEFGPSRLLEDISTHYTEIGSVVASSCDFRPKGLFQNIMKSSVSAGAIFCASATPEVRANCC